MSKSALDEKEEKIRQFFQNPSSPHHYINYQQFFKHFVINDSNYKSENLNLIDIHLRYRWFVRQKMAAYKWIPILCITPILFHNFYLTLIIPYFTVQMFDHYFQSFFIWRYKQQRIINIRNQFITKLSKSTSKTRRIQLFQNIQDALGLNPNPSPNIEPNPNPNPQKFEPPIKYIKFGQFTEYIFHATIGQQQQSSILQTTLFETFLALKDFIIGFNQLTILKQIASSFKDDFLQFKKDSNRTKYQIDTSVLIDRQEIKDVQVYSLEDNFDHNIRRYSQIWNYSAYGNLEPSAFKLWQYTNFSKFQDIFEPTKYNIKNNSADLLLYYSILAVPKLFKVLFKRR